MVDNLPEPLGREDEIAVLVDHLGTAGAGALLLTGPAGIGKTTLLAALARRAEVAGRCVVRVRATEIEQSLPYVTLGDVVAGLGPAHLDGLPAHHRAALEVALLTRAPAGAGATVAAVPVALRELLERAGRDRPLLLAVDDLQWVDRESLVALTYAVRRLRGRVSLVATVREPVEEELAALGDRLAVGPLPVDAGVRLVRSVLGEPSSYSLALRVHRAASGNPMLALELARAVAEQSEWSSDRLSELVPSDALAGSVAERVSSLPDAVRDVLAHAAAVARPTVDLLTRCCGPGVAEHLAEARRAGLVLTSGSAVRFAHPLYAAALLGDLAPADRRAVHRRLAELPLEEEELAWHRARACEGTDAEVAAVVERAALRARGRGAPHGAAELGALARDLTPLEHVADRARRGRLVGASLVDAGDLHGARDVLERLRDELAPGADRATTRVSLSEVLYELEGPTTAEREARAALQEAGDAPLVAAAAHLALVDRSHADAAERLSHAREALTLLSAGPEDDPRLRAQALREIALARFHRGDGMPAEILEAMELERTLADPPPVAWAAETCYAECIKYLDRLDEADTLLDTCHARAEQVGDLASLVDVLGHRAELALWLGRVEEGGRLATRARTLAEELEQHGRVGIAAAFAVLAAAHAGDLPAGRREGQLAADAELDEWSCAMLAHARGRLELWWGDAEEARRQLETCDRLARSRELSVPRQWRYLGDFVEALVATGERCRARERLEDLRAWAAVTGLSSSAGMARRAAGVLAEAEGDLDRAAQELEAAVAAFASVGMRFHAARTRVTLGAVLRRARRRRLARETLTAAVLDLREMGALGWVATAESELARVSGRAGSAGALTPAEEQVATLVVQGLSNKEVAAALSISLRTVEAHLTRVYAKVGVRSRAGLASRLR
ncbi:ATP-binding protein [Nocardioides marmoribigeumensis]|uniref:DNA-binding CsgD family transcriptional regulator/DNA polymerase III delta prime subunit/predicted nucleic acid-binding protein n=1 Tax=Nocardioides marmoribigeumensis TaxID=433649 RepID=A0ABU2BV84_9ACTN|nr:AAA family ATPase [Nocardioides marmoribigeumensis]MDR7362538.1 DNA-binding CsgD family transcriptional regulator/DNA polymerase III delta prime subunit/predicted nucleic acid-binding protein [Nocardioides marmoribigeumensis]